ncbi:MAG: rhodanese-like domain-containing protein [Clostridiaceae bacterium]
MKKSMNVFILLIIFILPIILSSCTKEVSAIAYKDITAKQAKEELDNDSSIVLLDVRTQQEYDEGHIKESILIPLDQLKSRAEGDLKDKNAKIFVYCRSGNRSKQAAIILNDLGYTNVFDLGGIIDWPYEIEK